MGVTFKLPGGMEVCLQNGSVVDLQFKDRTRLVGDFKECPECSQKTGMPTLCESCLHNRDLISKLRDMI